jgi:endonuclease/exonuclease/phosphatase family metal-dependent hydrolase
MEGRLKIICLNTWAGIAGIDPLLKFFEHYKNTDIFCLQEIWNGGEDATKLTAAGRSLARVETQLLQKIMDALPNHAAFFTPQHDPCSYFGVAIFVRKGIEVVDTGRICVYREPGYISPVDIADHARVLQYITIKTVDGPMTILNVHAAWQPNGKMDTPERLEQSRRIVEFSHTFAHPLILAGDFNLHPETESIRNIENAGWENLIRTYGITSTRTSLYHKPEPFADYIFIKNGIRVHDFHVLPEEVSDHAALFLEYSL